MTKYNHKEIIFVVKTKTKKEDEILLSLPQNGQRTL